MKFVVVFPLCGWRLIRIVSFAQLALQSYMNARSLLDENSWKADPSRTAALYMRLAECVLVLSRHRSYAE